MSKYKIVNDIYKKITHLHMFVSETLKSVYTRLITNVSWQIALQEANGINKRCTRERYLTIYILRI